MPISRCSRPPPRTCWQSRRSDEIKTKLEETVKLLRLCRSLPLRLLTGRLLPCILFIYLLPICTNWKQRTAKGGGRYPESIPPETAGKTIGSAAGSADPLIGSEPPCFLPALYALRGCDRLYPPGAWQEMGHYRRDHPVCSGMAFRFPDPDPVFILNNYLICLFYRQQYPALPQGI